MQVGRDLFPPFLAGDFLQGFCADCGSFFILPGVGIWRGKFQHENVLLPVLSLLTEPEQGSEKCSLLSRGENGLQTSIVLQAFTEAHCVKPWTLEALKPLYIEISMWHRLCCNEHPCPGRRMLGWMPVWLSCHLKSQYLVTDRLVLGYISFLILEMGFLFCIFNATTWLM